MSFTKVNGKIQPKDYGDILKLVRYYLTLENNNRYIQVDSEFLDYATFKGFHPIGSWDTSLITVMTNLFNAETSDLNGETKNYKNFNDDLSGWDTSNVEYMDGVFYNSPFLNQDISGWNTSKVKTMKDMFNGTKSFNQDISNWDTSSVKTMESMFAYSVFNNDLGDWNTGNVTNMQKMFQGNDIFNHFGISNWDSSNVTNMSLMFQNATGFGLGHVDLLYGWNVKNVTNMEKMFNNAINFNSQEVGSWNVKNVTNMVQMFAGATKFNQTQALENWNLNDGNIFWFEMFANSATSPPSWYTGGSCKIPGSEGCNDF